MKLIDRETQKEARYDALGFGKSWRDRCHPQGGGQPPDSEIARLENLGFVAGGSVTVVAAFQGNIIVNVKEARVAISEEMARKIMI